MPKTREQKKDMLQAIKDKLAAMKSVIFVNFSGTKVGDIEKLRNDCRAQGAEYLVAKKTLLKKALDESNIEGIKEQNFEGEVAAVFGNSDEVAPAKLVGDFARDNEQMQIIAGVLENKVIDVDMVNTLSKLPSRDELLAKAVGSIAAPLSGMVNVLQGNIRKLVYVLSAISDKKS